MQDHRSTAPLNRNYKVISSFIRQLIFGPPLVHGFKEGGMLDQNLSSA